MRQLISIICIFIIAIINRLPSCLGGQRSLIVVRAVEHYGVSEAINRQGMDLFSQLRNAGRGYYCVSLDDCFSINRIGGQNVLSIKSKFFSKAIYLIAPRSIILFHSCLVDIIKYSALFRGRSILITLTSNNPAINIDSSDIKTKNIIHLNDSGVLRIVCHSERARDSLEALGFLNVDIMPPYVKLDNFDGYCRNIDKIIKIGFASSPLQSSDYKSKGCELIFEEAAVIPGYQFKILWRSKAIKIPDAIPFNVQILHGILDMGIFYKEVDAIIIPYTTLNNHSFPLTIIEAMRCGLPVIVSEVCGCSDYVRKCGAGILFKPTSGQLHEAILTLNKSIEDNKYLQETVTEFIQNEMVESLAKYQQIILRLDKSQSIIDLLTWHKSLQSHGKKLIVGKHEIEMYYKQKNIVTNYDESRFTTLAHKLISNVEQDFVCKYCQKQEEKKLLLDLACGTGRFRNVYSLFGKVKIMDTSIEMLNNCQSATWFNSKNTECVQGDIFHIDKKEKYDAIVCFRLIRHLLKYERRDLFQILRDVLTDSGRVYMDVPLRESESIIRNYEGWYNYPVYDFFWDENGFIEELDAAGLEIDTMEFVEGKELGQKWKNICKFQMVCSVKKRLLE